MIDLIKTIAASVEATPALTAGLVGGLFLHHPGPAATLPFVVLEPVSAVPEFDTSADYSEPTTLQFSFYCRKLNDVKANVKLFKDHFLWKPLADTEDAAVTYGINLNNELAIYESADNTDLQTWHYVLEFEFMVNRDLA